MKKYILFVLIFLYTPSWAQFGNALVFDGLNDYVDCGDDVSLNMSDALTLEAWINTSITTNARIISKWGSGSGYEMAFIATDELWFTINQVWRGSYAAAGLANQWTHLAVTYNGTTSLIYVNGNLESTWQNLQENLVNTGLVLKIGNISNAGSSYFSGMIDEVRVWNRERSQQQIQSTMNAVLSPAYYSSQDSGLVGYWQFEEGAGDTTLDLSVHNNHGIINGASWDITTKLVDNNTPGVETNFTLLQNYPNPFNPSTKITFTIPQAEFVIIEIYNALGQKIKTLLNKPMPQATMKLNLKLKICPQGYIIITSGQVNFRK